MLWMDIGRFGQWDADDDDNDDDDDDGGGGDNDHRSPYVLHSKHTYKHFTHALATNQQPTKCSFPFTFPKRLCRGIYSAECCICDRFWQAYLYLSRIITRRPEKVFGATHACNMHKQMTCVEYRSSAAVDVSFCLLSHLFVGGLWWYFLWMWVVYAGGC